MSTPTPPYQPADQTAGLVVRYNRGLGIAALVVGVLMLVLGINIVVCVVFTVLGIACIAGKALVLTPTELQLKSPIGVTTKRFPVSGPSDLRMDGKTLYHVPQDKKVISLGFGVDKGDVERLRAVVGGAGAH
jgi:hypothetical protein